MPAELPTAYNPKETEERIYKLWEESGFFTPENLLGERKKKFTTCIAPPNITGELHMGHALELTLQDIVVRFKRMQGYKTLWLPGTDHAGIAAQNVVEKQLTKEGLSRHKLGREKFLERMWQWRDKYGGAILEQFKKLGVSVDWSRLRFTMDDAYQKAVTEAFVHYYNKGWIYRGERVVNWCVRCGTAVSDLEVNHVPEKGKLYFIKYGPFTLATARPETKLGDTALAVHPTDARYKKHIGTDLDIESVDNSIAPDEPPKKKTIKIKVVADEAVDKEFGTGIIKVTPSHDITDSEIGQRHSLPSLTIIEERGRMNENAGVRYEGLKTSEAREKIVADLDALGLMEKIEDYEHNVGRCERCNSVIEPLPSRQWFLTMKKLAENTLEFLKIQRTMPDEYQKIKFYPNRWWPVVLRWLENIRDWNISRQLWWGHQIPVWYCGNADTVNRMGFAESVIPRLYNDMTKTYRLRDYGLAVGDEIVFENSQTRRVFGKGKITEVTRTTVGGIDLHDTAHGETYTTCDGLIAAFKRHHPEKPVTENTPAFLYSFTFTPYEKHNIQNDCGEIILSTERPSQCPTCGSKNLHQDTDVLDTWFSSALWPFATLGWPNKETSDKRQGTRDFEEYYPTDFITSDRGILFLWQVRMVLSGMEFTGTAPFKDILIHATVLTKDGKRMSKSLGTGVNPLELIEKYGTDALRFGLASQATGLQDIRFGEDLLVMGKKFTNKLWNISRFILANEAMPNVKDQMSKVEGKTEADKEILKRLAAVTDGVTKNIEQYEFADAANALYHFIWHEFADKYIETSKQQLADPAFKEGTIDTLYLLLATCLKLLHPFMPFVTEEIWSKLPPPAGGQDKQLLIVEKWPS